MLRTHTCGELRAEHVDQTVTVCGWVDSRRDHGGLVFIDLRDRYGKVQIVFDPSQGDDLHNLAGSVRNEYVLKVTGKVVRRAEKDVNPKIPTGEIDVRSNHLEVLNASRVVPFEPGTLNPPNEELRLKYRFLDLRRPRLQELMVFRHRLTKLVRDYFDRHGFLEIETPMLGRSTPEGARDYLVPSRVHPGCFYALPQSPQIYKQILMIAGYDRYMQIARCFRDEDLRADRQPEFTQVDIEMAFVDREDILQTVDGLVAFLMQEIRGVQHPLPLPRLTYAESMERFGSDKPDLRYGMELKDIGDIAANCGFGVFKNALASGGRVRGLNAVGAAAKYSRKQIDELTVFVGDFKAKGLAFFRVTETGLDSPIAKFFGPEEQQAIIQRFDAKAGDLIFIVADQPKVTSAALGALRSRLGKELALFDPNEMHFAWILDFPLFSYNEEEKKWDAEHHPFCNPVPDDVGYFETDPGKIRATSYDLVVNGYEGASGSVRIHDPVVQQKVFDLLGIPAEEAEKRFSFLLEALRYGAPPHAGIALGLDRWVMMFTGCDNIRDVIAFPKTQKAADLLSGAPSNVDAKQLKELSIKIDEPKA
ncbi:MAG: aspartate--tRNA ligase [Planctomycetes bacterium]|nr:aspartate--tRNA ligase [Planctomycetota bacterium]